MSFTFGNRPEDVVTDSRGNTLSGVALTLYGTEADASAQVDPVTTVTTENGMWSYESFDDSVLWVRTPNGGTYSIASTGSTMDDFIDQVVTPGTPANNAILGEVTALTGPMGSPGVRWVALGDSLTSLAGGGAPYMGWVTQSGLLSNGQLLTLQNAGVPGNDAAQALVRLTTDVLPYSPTLVTLWVGTNDITNGRTLAEYQADVTATVDAIQAIGATVVLFTIPPRADSSKYAAIGLWNGWLKSYARDNSINIIDAYAALVDPSTGDYAAGLGSGDGIHISQAGHNAVAQVFVDTILPRAVSSEPLSPSYNADPNNLLANGLILSGTDAAPTSWFPQGGPLTGFVEGRVSDADFKGGKAWQVAATTPGSFRQFTGNATSAWAEGDELLFTCKVKVVSSSGVPASSGLDINCNFFGGTGVNPAIQYLSLSGLSGQVSHRLTVPPGTTTVQLDCVFNPSAAGTATWRVGEFGIYNLTAMGLA